MNRKERFSVATNYALYYGHGRATELAIYDIAVLEPAGQTNDSLQEIKSSGTLAIAYLSVLEIPVWSKDLDFLESCDFIQLNGEPYINPEYGNYWANLASQRWTNLLLNRVNDLLEKDYDGLFLDTIAYLESKLIPENLRSTLLLAARKLLGKIRVKFPDHIIIQNCGLEDLYQHTVPYLDGICWENPPLNQVSSQEWMAKVIENLESIRKVYDLQIFLLVEENHSCAKEFNRLQALAKAKRFLVYYAPSLYTTGVSLKTSVK